MDKNKEKIIWVLKEKVSGKHMNYFFKKKYASDCIEIFKYYKGFKFKPLEVVKAKVIEIKGDK